MVTFNTIPSNLRVPLFYAEVDGSQAGSPGTGAKTSLIIGQRLTGSGTVAELTPVSVATEGQAIEYFGRGSMLHWMVKRFRANNPTGELVCIALDDPSVGAAAATGTITVTGPATADGTISLYIHGQLVEVAVTSGDVQNDIATAIDAAITAETDLQVTSSVLTNVVTVTAKNLGEKGDEIDIRENLLGVDGGEETPAGVSLAIVAMSGGTGTLELDQAITAMADDPYDYICQPYTSTTELDLIEAEMDDTSGRWSPTRKIYGHAFHCHEAASVAALTTFGNLRNDPHTTVMGIVDAVSPSWEWAASLTGAASLSLENHAARPLQTLELNGIVIPPKNSAGLFTISERNTLLYDGVATWTEGPSRTAQIERSITTYQLDAFSNPDDAFLDVTTLATLQEHLERLESAITTNYARKVLVDNGTRFGPGVEAVTPDMLKSAILAEYLDLEAEALAENFEAFRDNLVVERSTTDPNRVDVLYPPDLANQLRIFAVLAQFRLQY